MRRPQSWSGWKFGVPRSARYALPTPLPTPFPAPCLRLGRRGPQSPARTSNGGPQEVSGRGSAAATQRLSGRRSLVRS